MKKLLCMILSLALLLSLCACDAASASPWSKGKLRIVTTIFPVYDWTKNLLGDQAENAELVLLTDKGGDLHSYQPSAQDILKIATCDVFIYVGGESDKWVEEVLEQQMQNQDCQALRLMDLLEGDLLEEEFKEGMEPEEEEDGPAYDEHVWLSLANARMLCTEIARTLRNADPDHGDSYQNALQAYTGRIQELDSLYRTFLSEPEVNTLVFADRFPFLYLMKDYDLNYYAAFPGCSSETEASFETIVFLADKVTRLSLPTVLTIEGGDRSVAETVVEQVEHWQPPILTMNSMQSVSAQDVKNGMDYLSVMEENLGVLQQATTRVEEAQWLG